MRYFSFVLLIPMMAGCGGNVSSTVLQDFGLQERPEGYVSGSDQVMSSLRSIGVTELARLNIEHRHGEVKYDSSQDLRGRFYKELRVYTKAYPLDANATGSSADRKKRGYVGYIEYAYQLKESPRFSNRTEAAAAAAEIPGGKGGRERYRYRFSAAGVWTGAKGELDRS